MTASTVDHVDYVPEAVITPVVAAITSDETPEASEQRVLALRIGEPLHPDPAARAKIAAVLYLITGWETFGYAELAASETAEEAEEHRRILRRRRPPWADED
jgi:hypothetical protein